MHISNPITPVASELRQSITIAKNRIAELKDLRSKANTELSIALNLSIDWWLGKLADCQIELDRIEELKNVK